MLIRSALCASFLVLGAFSTSTPPSTSCTTFGGNHKTTRSYTRDGDCTNTVTRTQIMTSTVTPVTTSLVYSTSIITVDTSTNTATDTETVTTTIYFTTTSIETFTATTTTTSTSTSFYATSAGTKRSLKTPAKELELRARKPTSTAGGPPTASPGVVCVIERCQVQKVTTTSTLTTTLPTSTTTSTSTVVSTSTPYASTTTTVTTDFTSTSTFTEGGTTTTTTTTTKTLVYHATPTFYIVSSSGAPTVADGTQLSQYLENPAYYYSPWLGTANNGSLFTLDPNTGYLYNFAGFSATGFTQDSSSIYLTFSSVAFQADNDGVPCVCAIDQSSMQLDCDCHGGVVDWQNQVNYNGVFLVIGDAYRELEEVPLVSIVNQQ